MEERLYNIRHCLDIEGLDRPLPLWQPPIDPEILVRATAAFALAQIPDPRVTEILRTHLKDSDWRIRQTAHEIVNGQNPSFPG